MVRDNPYPHIIWDNFIDAKTLGFVKDEFPTEESDFWTWKSNDTNSIKYMCQDQFLIEKLPNINKLIKYLNSSYFCSILSSIFKIPKLVSDGDLAGGGLHMIGNGGFLKVHADFNQSDKKPGYHRRLNLILYLSDDWKDSYNGNLELWNTDLTKAEVEIEPLLNRMICFNTQPDGNIVAYHGHPKPLNVPQDVYRKSIALYYYTKEKPQNIFSEKHKTLYMDTV